MEDFSIRYKVRLTVVSPISIGAGQERDWVMGVDYVEQGGKIYKLNLRKLLESGITASELSGFLISRNGEGLKRKLGDRLRDVSDMVFTSPIRCDNIKTFIRSELSGKPIIPGSSLKGAVRSVIYKYLKAYLDAKNMGSLTDGNDFMRYISISDVEFEKTGLVNTKIFNLQSDGRSEWIGGWKHGASKTDSHFSASGFNTVYECLMPGQSATTTITISPGLFKLWEIGQHKQHPKAEKKLEMLNKGLPFIFGIINEHMYYYLNKELDFLEKYAENDSVENGSSITDSLNGLFNRLPEEGESNYCFLKMAAGTGFHSITGDWQFENFIEDEAEGTIFDRKRNRGQAIEPRIVLPKSRKIAIWKDYSDDEEQDNVRFSPMGFIKLSILKE